MSKELIIFDNVWGNIKLDVRYAQIINLFPELKEKHQLGLFYRNPNFTGGMHTRYDHSIGTYYVATRLIKACEKFSDYFEIPTRDVEAFLLSTLLHDIGHGPYSHAFEKLTTISHEEETIRMVEGIKYKIDYLFGEGMCEKVIAILQNSYNIKKNGQRDINRKPDLVFVLSALLSGAIDVDRIDYLIRDLINVMGIREDFTKIFDYMQLDLVDDLPKIVFSEECVSIIEDYFLRRYRNYNDIYFEKFDLIHDKNFEWFLKETYLEDELNVNLRESIIDYKIKYGEYNNFKAKRCAEVLESKEINEILYKKFYNHNDLNVFLIKLSSIIEVDDYFFGRVDRKVVIYDSKKNNVLIKVGDKVLDFSEVSKVIKDEISKETILIFIDLILLEEYLKESEISSETIRSIKSRIAELFNSSMHEVEKKFVLEDKNSESIDKYLQSLATLKETKNVDHYFCYDEMPRDISIRKRYKKEYTLKLPAKDSTSLTKRQEHLFDISIKEKDFLEMARKILIENGYLCDNKIKRDIKVITNRKIYVIKNKGSILEVALDHSQYIYRNDIVNDIMLEIELKQGNPIAIFYFIEEIKKITSELKACQTSKYNRALDMLKM